MTGMAGLRVLGVMLAVALLVPAERAMAQHGHGGEHHGAYPDGSHGYGEPSRGDHYSSPRTHGRYSFDGHENGYRYDPRHRSQHARHGDYNSSSPHAYAPPYASYEIGPLHGRQSARPYARSHRYRRGHHYRHH